MDSSPDNTVIELRDASLGYLDSPVLTELNLKIRRGDVVAILGGSGSGKTTILQAMLGLIAPISGEALLFGQPAAQLKDPERSHLFSRIGVVFQQNALFTDMSVAENLAIVARQRTDIREEVLRELIALQLLAVGLPGLEARRPDRLSGGQRKRVAFARAMMLSPEILFCDEPTAGLDPLTSATVRNLIGELAADLGTTLLIVTHDLDLIHSIATRVLLVSGGHIYADAPLSELLASSDALVAGLLHLHHPSQEAK